MIDFPQVQSHALLRRVLALQCLFITNAKSNRKKLFPITPPSLTSGSVSFRSVPFRSTGNFQVLATTHTVKDYVHALNSGIEFRFEIKDILVVKIATARSSCKASRTSAYSHDLRWRIVWQREALNLSVREVAGN